MKQFIRISFLAFLVLGNTSFKPSNSSMPSLYDVFELMEAVEYVESRGNHNLKNDSEGAYGCLQIRQVCLTDVNKHFGTHFNLNQMLGEKFGHTNSVYVFRKYMEKYATPERLGRDVTREDMAGIWNGGPNGWKKTVTGPYWEKVKKRMEKLGYL